MEEQAYESLKKLTDHLDDWQLLEEGPRSGVFYLSGPHDVRDYVSQVWDDKGKLSFQVSPDQGLHEFETYNADKPQASVSVSRNPVSAAKDVRRRCLDPSIPYVLALRKKKAASDARDNEQWDKLALLATSVGGQIFKGLHTKDTPMEVKAGRGDYPNIEVRAKLRSDQAYRDGEWITSPLRIDITLDRLPFELACDMLAWLRLRLWPENGEQGRLF